MNFNVRKLNADLFWREPLEVVSKPLRGPNLGVGARRLILKILNVFRRLNASPRLDIEPD